MKAKRILSKLDPDIFPEHGEAHPEFDQQALPQRKGKWKGPYVQPNSFGSIHEEPEMKKRMPLISFDHQVRTPAHQLANEDAREVIFSAIVILLSVAAVVCLLGLAFGWWA